MVGIREFPNDLIERVESGAGEDRILEGDIAELFNPDRFKPGFVRGQARRYTSSLDAVVSLIEQKLPGWGYDITYRAAWEGATASVCDNHKHALFHRGTVAPGQSPARALLAACLRAIQAQARTLADAHSKNPPEAEHG